ncbi:MAG: biotin/lipoyl-binding protein, partial [Halothece sp. Uz-M2-17]|nr:biotin/lipoyl-binding protein [Halothece sp. Uz-M2-17]
MQLPGMGKVHNPVRWIVGILAVGTLTVGTSVYLLNRNKQEYNLEALTVPVEQKNLQVTIEASGKIQPVQSVNLSPKTAGRLEALYVEQGDRVERGQAIAVMENDQLQAQLDRAKSNLAEAQARLAEAQAGSRLEEIEQARASLEQAKARLAEAQARIPENI